MHKIKWVALPLLLLLSINGFALDPATPVDDTEDGYLDEKPIEELPPPEFAAPADDADLPAPTITDSSVKPKPKAVVRPPSDEPLPLIKRQRQAVEFSMKPEAKRIRHPNAAKGLTRITKDKVYVYKVKTSPQKEASSFHFGFLNPTKLRNHATEIYFNDYYKTTQNPGLLFDYERQVFQRFGKFGLKVGTGLAFATGNGQFATNSNPGLVPKEKFTFVIIPNTIGGVYRLAYWDKQMFIPYVEGGGALFGFAELRDDNKKPKFGGAIGGYAAGGLAISLNSFDRISMLEMDREYGINSVYAIAEYRAYIGGGNFDFSTQMINGGLLVEF